MSALTGGGKAGGSKFIGSDDYRGRLAYEAKKGDADAKVALKYAGNDGRYDGPVKSAGELAALRRAGVQGGYYYRKGSSISYANASGF